MHTLQKSQIFRRSLEVSGFAAPRTDDTLYLFRSLRSSCYGSLNGALDLILALQGTVVNELRDRRYLMMLSLCFVGGLDHVRIQYRITTVGDAALLQKVIQPLYSLIF